MKLCVNCKHHMPHKSDESYDKCALTSKLITSPVRGTGMLVYSYCDVERSEHGGCGPGGLKFEQKDNEEKTCQSPVTTQTN